MVYLGREVNSDTAQVAEERYAALQAEIADLSGTLAREMEEIDLTFVPESASLGTVEIRAKQSEMHVVEIALA